MSRLSGLPEPQNCGRAFDAACWPSWPHPGQCNPDDETSMVDGEPSDESLPVATPAQARNAITTVYWPGCEAC